MSTTRNRMGDVSPRRLLEALRGVVGRRARHVLAIVGTATLVWLPASPSQAQLSVAPSWCNTHAGQERPWVTFLGQRPQSYALQLSGNPGLLPNGQVALLGYFASPTGGAVYFVPNTGAANPPRIRLGLVTNISAPSNDPLNYQGTISLPVNLLPFATDSQGIIGNLVFELSGVVTQTVPLYWPTTDVSIQATAALPEWDPLQSPQAALVAGSLPTPGQFEFTLEFRGCPPLYLGGGTVWNSGKQFASLSMRARNDRTDSGVGQPPGHATIWIDEKDLYHLPHRTPTDYIAFWAGSGSAYFQLRKPLTIIPPPQPSSIDLGLRKCSYEIAVTYTGGYGLDGIWAFEEKGPPLGSMFAFRIQGKSVPRALLGGAVLTMQIPAELAIRAAGHSSRRVWVQIAQKLGGPPDAPPDVDLEIDVINAPQPPSAARPSGPCP